MNKVFVSKAFIFLGPPGVGKGTQCARVAERFSCIHVSTGSIIRSEIASGSHLGSLVESEVNLGKLVADDLILECFSSYLARAFSEKKSPLVLLDGIPRNINQANSLSITLEPFSCSVAGVILLKADLSKLIVRFTSRLTCKVCHYVFSSEPQGLSFENMHCPKCSALGTLYRRSDDALDVVKNRFKIYENDTEPLVAYYAQRGPVFEVDGMLPPDLVFEKVASILSNF